MPRLTLIRIRKAGLTLASLCIVATGGGGARRQSPTADLRVMDLKNRNLFAPLLLLLSVLPPNLQASGATRATVGTRRFFASSQHAPSLELHSAGPRSVLCSISDLHFPVVSTRPLSLVLTSSSGQSNPAPARPSAPQSFASSRFALSRAPTLRPRALSVPASHPIELVKQLIIPSSASPTLSRPRPLQSAPPATPQPPARLSPRSQPLDQIFTNHLASHSTSRPGTRPAAPYAARSTPLRASSCSPGRCARTPTPLAQSVRRCGLCRWMLCGTRFSGTSEERRKDRQSARLGRRAGRAGTEPSR